MSARRRHCPFFGYHNKYILLFLTRRSWRNRLRYLPRIGQLFLIESKDITRAQAFSLFLLQFLLHRAHKRHLEYSESLSEVLRITWQVKCQKASSVVWMQAPASSLSPLSPSSHWKPQLWLQFQLSCQSSIPMAFHRVMPQINKIISRKNPEVKKKQHSFTFSSF